jgi:hypothetical protein
MVPFPLLFLLFGYPFFSQLTQRVTANVMRGQSKKTRFVLQAEQWQDGGVQRKGQNIQVLASVVQAMPSTT